MENKRKCRSRNMDSVSWRVLGTFSFLCLAMLADVPPIEAEKPVIDSAMTMEQALANLDPRCPAEIKSRQKLVEVQYYSLDGRIHQGQIVIDERLVDDIKNIFQVALEMKFPIESVNPVSAPVFQENGRWSDERSMAANNTSAFNYRETTGGTSLSNHAYGYAIDINPLWNPYFKGDTVLPPGARYDPQRPGTLTQGNPVVEAFLARGWTWGGHWTSLKDYQHFEKIPLVNRKKKKE